MPVSLLSLLPGSRLPSLPSQLSKGKRLCFSTRVLLYICRQLIKYFHFTPFPSGNRCLTAKLFCLTRAATDYTCWLQTRGLFLPPSPPFAFFFKRTKSLSLHCQEELCLSPRALPSSPVLGPAGGIRPPAPCLWPRWFSHWG